MESQILSTQICRLCLENEADNGGFLIEIFSSLINEAGKQSLSEKIRELFGLKVRTLWLFVTHPLTFNDSQIVPDDGLPKFVCHKCLVLTENCMDFRDKCLKNDEKLRLIFKVPEPVEEAAAQDSVMEAPAEAEPIEEDEEEVITLNPNKLYESSDDSENEIPETSRVSENLQTQATVPSTSNHSPSAPVPKANNDLSKKEIFHCQFCDVVFSDSISCASHEQKSHDPVYPYECVACTFKTDQHSTLIYHIKQTHNMEKPFFCTQCTKTFIRRSDLKKHTFVHSGIRLYCCDICKKSFTRNTNLTKHKRTHSDKFKSWKCTLCPKAYFTNSELSRHLEIHMDRKALVCKFCNQAFVRRDLLELHQKTHLEHSSVPLNEALQSAPPITQPHSVVFYNQPPEQQQVAQPPQAPMNFYTENMSFNVNPSNGSTFQVTQPKKEYPIMNQLLAGIGFNPMGQMQPVKNFICGICHNSFMKKKELDRHVITIHTNVKQFKCETCSKYFNRKDKLLRHEKLHLTPPTVFNCPLCPAVFVRKQMLDFHSKIHQMGNGQPVEDMMASLQPVLGKSNGFPSQMMPELAQLPIQEPQATLFPMNLSVNKNFNEPMNLSNEKPEPLLPVMKTEPVPMVTVESEDEGDGLQIVEEANIKKSPTLLSYFKPEDIETTPEMISDRSFQMNPSEIKSAYDEPAKTINDLTFAMASRIADLDKLEPLRDLPMEILNND